MRYLIKIGTSTITNLKGEIDKSILRSLIYQISYIYRKNHDIILVTSGAVACGKNILSNNYHKAETENNFNNLLNLRTQAAIGQPYLINIFNELFKSHNLISAQILLQDTDFKDDARVTAIKSVINNLLENRIIPILNENDATTIRQQPYRDDNGKILWDNDSLSALVAKTINVDRLISVSNIDGVLDKHKKVILNWNDRCISNLGNISTSEYGRGGILSKIKAASNAANYGIDTFIVNGKTPNILINITKEVNDLEFPITTYFKATDTLINVNNKNKKNNKILTMLKTARDTANDTLRNSSHQLRCSWLLKFRDLLIEKKEGILKANKEDLEAEIEISSPLYKRLTIKDKTITTLCNGITELVNMEDPIAKRVNFNIINNPFIEGTKLEWSRCQIPMGLILVIFESRPDVLVQLLVLSVISGNGMILKGGREAEHSLIYLFSLFLEATPMSLLSAFNLLFTREEAEIALSSPDINLVIPRGSNKFINWVSSVSVAPVIGHGSGICCAYLDQDVDILDDHALELVRHSKLDYPAACNSLEILLINESYFGRPELLKAIVAWKAMGIELLADDEVCQKYQFLQLTKGELPTIEYGNNRLYLVKIAGLEEAIQFINKHGSGHTDLIITNNTDREKLFLKGVTSSCVFANCSTRCADGYRMKMGCEVGINTQMHSWFRGPVGIEALMTTQIRLS